MLVYKYILICVSVFCCIDNCCALKNKYCSQNGPCQCIFANGKGFNLTPLSSHNFGWIPINNTASIYFHLCTDDDSSLDIPECNKSICLKNAINSTSSSYIFRSLSKPSEAILSKIIVDKPPFTIEYPNGDLNVEMKCTSDQDKPNIKLKSVSGNKYTLELESKESCLTDLAINSGLSSGSVIILIFMTMFLVYFGGGILTLKYIRGAEGKEMIPNYEFWADLPNLVRDGIIFTLNGFQASPSYDRI